MQKIVQYVFFALYGAYAIFFLGSPMFLGDSVAEETQGEKTVAVSYNVVFSQGRVLAASDMLEDAFTPSKEAGQIIDIGNNKNAVGNTFFVKAVDIITGDTKDPLIIRVTKFILRVTVIAGVTMGLIVGVNYMLAQGDETKQKDLIKKLWNIVIGLLVALSALVVINLVLSVTKSTVVM